MLKIEKNIDPPKKEEYPYDKMKVGDSILIPCDDSTLTRVRSLAFSKARRMKTEFGITTRTIVEDGKVTGLRVWRAK